ncbi:MAG: formylmethanofuran dehydrogenase [Clostridiaceae bacterium]|nr:formylmethanofuran dehydrogenase [Clostridiaceae bacterium]
MNLDKKQLYQKCVDFHGHECPGLTIGFRAALYAIELLDLEFSEDEQVVCISENDACGVDAIQVLLGCSVGKGNLLFHLVGKQAFSIYERSTGKSVRLVLKQSDNNLSRAEKQAYFQTVDNKEMFEVKDTTLEVPERARLFESLVCESCHETAATQWMRIQEGKQVCLDCFKSYSRLQV